MALRGCENGTLAMLLLIGMACSAQQPSQGIFNYRSSTPSVYLQERGYTTREDVVRALSDADPKTRSNAASRLSEFHDPQAVRSINAALSVEKDDTVKMYEASALLSLGEANGQRLLEDYCGAGALSPEILRNATMQLTMRNKAGACADRVVAAYVAAQNGRERSGWIDLLTEVCKDTTPTRGASWAARKALQEELNAETDPVIKWRIRNALLSRVFVATEQQ